MVQALLDLLCSQLKTLLSQAAGSVLSTSPESEEKTDDGTDNTKKDFRGNSKTYHLRKFHIKKNQLHMQENKCVCVISALLPKQHTAELLLGDFLVFLRRVVSSKAIQSKMASPKWTEVLLNIAAQKCCSGTRTSQYRCVFLFRGDVHFDNLRRFFGKYLSVNA